jgi:hypothetical protein
MAVVRRSPVVPEPVAGPSGRSQAALVAEWDAARRAHGLSQGVMIARDYHTRHELNQAARARLIHAGLLPTRPAGRWS